MRNTFVKVHDNLLDHPAWADLEPEHVGLWVLALGYCRRNKTDGHFPAKVVRRWGGNERMVDELVEAGRVHAAGHQCEDCPQPEDGSLYVHAYLEHQNSRAQQDELSAKRAEAGRRGGKARHGKAADLQEQAPTKQVAKQKGGKSQPEGEGEGEKDSPAQARAAAAAADFDKFWTLYPRKIGKQAAQKSFTRALKSTPVEDIAAGLVNAVQVWRSSGTELRFIPHPSTWLNEGRWADEVPLPDMPTASTRVTLAQCPTPDECPGDRHEWADARGANRFMCMGDR